MCSNKDSEMNERIREVWIKAAREDSDPDNWDTQEQFIERFAELIVQECADWIDGSPSTDAGQLVLTKSFIIANIKEHFGVEE